MKRMENGADAESAQSEGGRTWVEFNVAGQKNKKKKKETSWISFTKKKIGLNPLRGFSPYTRNYTPMFATLRYPIRMFTTFLVLPIVYSRDACMDFDA